MIGGSNTDSNLLSKFRLDTNGSLRALSAPVDTRVFATGFFDSIIRGSTKK